MQDPLTQDPGAEAKHIQVIDAAAHDPTVCSIRPPLGHGVLYDWIQEMVSTVKLDTKCTIAKLLRSGTRELCP